jgi:hypothetical protein
MGFNDSLAEVMHELSYYAPGNTSDIETKIAQYQQEVSNEHSVKKRIVIELRDVLMLQQKIWG